MAYTPRYTPGTEWGRYVRETHPGKNLADAFLENFKESMAYRLAQEECKRQEQRQAREQKALEEYRNFQTQLQQAQERAEWMRQEQLNQEARDQWAAGQEGRDVDLAIKKKELELMGQEKEPDWAERQRIAQGWARINKDENDKETKIPTTLTTYVTPEGSALYSEIVDAYNNATNGDRSDFDALNTKIKNAQGAMSQVRTSVNEFGQTVTTSGASDYSKLITLYDTYRKDLEGRGIKPSDKPKMEQPITQYPANLQERVKAAVQTGDAQTLDELGRLYGEDVIEKIASGK